MKLVESSEDSEEGQFDAAKLKNILAKALTLKMRNKKLTKRVGNISSPRVSIKVDS